MSTQPRIRKGNTKVTYPNQNSSDSLPAVGASTTVNLGGQIGTDFNCNLVGLGDPAAQVGRERKNMKPLLIKAGCGLSRIVKITLSVIDSRYHKPVYQMFGKWLQRIPPVSTGLVISGLGQPQWLMEIAVVPGHGQSQVRSQDR